MGEKHYVLYPIVLIVFVLTNISQATLVVGVRGDEDALRTYISADKSRKLLETETKEFPNTNTFVRFLTDVSQQSVELLLPNVFTPDTLMEALIKARTAKTNGALEVRAVLAAPEQHPKLVGTKGKIPIDIRRLLAISGVITVLDHHLYLEPISFLSDLRDHRMKPSASKMVLSLDHGLVGAQIARTLSLPHRALKMNEPDLPKDSQVFFVSASAPPVNENFFETLYLMKRLYAANNAVFLVTPYLPYARSDKKDQPGVAVTGRLVADLIHGSGAAGVSFVRAHAQQSEGFFSLPSVHISGRETLNAYLKAQSLDFVVSPDAGFQKDATLYANELDLPIIVLNKQRDLVSGVAKIYEMSGVDLSGKTVAIIDDETASGGTLALAGEFLKGKGAKTVIAVVTHLTGDAAKALDSPAIDKVVVTDTLPFTAKSQKLQVLSIGREIGEGLLAFANYPQDCGQRLAKNE